MASPIRAPRLVAGSRSSKMIQSTCRRISCPVYRQRLAQVFLQTPPERRTFTTSTIWQAKQKGQAGMLMPQPKQKPQKSVKVTMEELKEKMQLPDDNGLLPGTFVPSIRANRPDVWKNWRGRWLMEKKRIKAWGRDMLGNIVFKTWLVRRIAKPAQKAMSWPTWLRRIVWRREHWPHLQYRAVPRIAQELYEQMYRALAAGSLDKVAPRLCENIRQSLESRIAARGPNTSLQWTLHRYLGRPKVVSYRSTLFSKSEEDHLRTTLQQAVVRIRSRQSLQKVRKVRQRDGTTLDVLEEGGVADAGGQGREVTEYLVVQKLNRKGQSGQWMIWGTVKETTLAEIEAEEKKRVGLPDV